MNASRKLIDQQLGVARHNLSLFRSRTTRNTGKITTKRDGRVRLMREAGPTAATLREEIKLRSAHERLRLPSLERWLRGREW
jgi:hypothetical protein